VAKLIFAITRRSAFGYSPQEQANQYIAPDAFYTNPGVTPPTTPGFSAISTERPQTTAYALSDSPSGLLAHILDAIQPQSISSSTVSPSQSAHSLRVPPTPSGRSPTSSTIYGTPQTGRSPQSSGSSPQTIELSDVSNAWTPTALIDWTMLYWLPGPEVALRWLVHSSNLVSALWLGYSAVPLAITHFREARSPGGSGSQTPPQWAEAYHRIAMVRSREGRVRFPAWERPAELVVDLREFAGLLGITPVMPVTNGV
jgi:hypothetical protein